jgi:hypothetical protein
MTNAHEMILPNFNQPVASGAINSTQISERH